mmetsp:Transcript_51551/g.85412  ORF Transcript_51551/g.85412 Transcript_51551/m.85412 type:complete len:241 (+) Transcript_51551:34-756(+)|eukprot:CAMPEP_0202712640 /NCGR_PEP_ID=MMETSP1385-20130828/43554_1 /ASSEMBLY_ACC=CAM_ASM_000861 /TAXON_ID=933848 /ORGANISM="Elphidium margaritaceum" /LENGTH=240 /DNA_ID=CAMNT_0049372729 /DNA_START=29 /DNA_END=751 /DNA_ORIENTATION=+
MRSCLTLYAHCSHQYKPAIILRSQYVHKALFSTPSSSSSSNVPTPAVPPSAVEAREVPHADREQSLREGHKMYMPGPPFQFAVRTDRSVRFMDWSKMFPHYELVKDRVTLVPSFTTSSLAQSRMEVTRLYRKILRRIPHMLQDYNAWHVSVKHANKRISEEFRKNAHVRDIRVIDKLRTKAEQEYQGYLIARPHENIVYRLFTPQEQENPVPGAVRKKQPHGKSEFLSNFYAGTDNTAEK